MEPVVYSGNFRPQRQLVPDFVAVDIYILNTRVEFTKIVDYLKSGIGVFFYECIECRWNMSA